MGRRGSAVQALWAVTKALAQGRFIRPAQVRSLWGPPGLALGARKKYGLKAARRAPQFSKR